MKVKNRVMELMQKKASREKRKVPDAELARAINMSTAGLSKWVNNEITEFRADTIDAMCRFFHCQVGDLLVLVNDDGSEVEWE